MNYFYFDSSALIKRYVKETGSESVDSLFAKGNVFTSMLTYAETLATFYRLFREGLFERSWLKKIVKAFEDDWSKINVVMVSDAELKHLPHLFEAIQLRGADSVQLATAIQLQEQGFNLSFVSCDFKLLKAAKKMKIKSVNPAL